MEYFGLRVRSGGKALPLRENRFGVGRPNCLIHELKPRLPIRQAQARLVAGFDNSGSCRKSMSSSRINPVFGLDAMCSSTSSSPNSRKNMCEETVSAEKLDQWMRDSVSEIVRNIGDAPFLIHVYSKKSITKTRLHREKAPADSWPHITRGWEQRTSIPDGIILVEQLKSNHYHHVVEEEGIGVVGPQQPHSTTGVWGVLIQGRGVDCPACYILKTCRVCSSIGFCTHFCLVRAKCFGETADWQLNNCWLL